MIQRCGVTTGRFDLTAIAKTAEALGYDAQVTLLLTLPAESGLREAMEKHASHTEHLR